MGPLKSRFFGLARPLSRGRGKKRNGVTVYHGKSDIGPAGVIGILRKAEGEPARAAPEIECLTRADLQAERVGLQTIFP